MDGVKISVNKEGEEKKLVKKKRGRPRKVVKKKPARPSMVEARSSSKQSPKPSKNKKGGFMSVLIAILVTSTIVGGSIYAWQSRSNEQGINDVRQDARQVRIDFEQRLSQLKNKLTGIETENKELKDTTKELEEKAKLLEGSKKDFSNPEIGLSFEYPAVFGEVKVEMIEGVSGKKFKATFGKNEKLIFGGVDVEYQPKASSSKIDFLESQGYYAKKNSFYFQTIRETDSTNIELAPSKEIKAGDSLVLLLDKKSFTTNEETGEISVDIGENIGAIVNLETGDFRGVTFLNQDLNVLPLENFETLLSSIVIKE